MQTSVFPRDADTLEIVTNNPVNSYTLPETHGLNTTLRLSESGGATDQVAFVGGTNIEVVRTDASTITLNNTFTETDQNVLQTVNSDAGSYTVISAQINRVEGGAGIPHQ